MKKWIITIGIAYLVIGVILLFVYNSKKDETEINKLIEVSESSLEDILIPPKIENEHGVSHSHDSVESTMPPDIALSGFIIATNNEEDADILLGFLNADKALEGTEDMGFDEMRKHIEEQSKKVVQGIESVNLINYKNEKNTDGAFSKLTMEIELKYHDGRSKKKTTVEVVDPYEKNVYVLNHTFKELHKILQEQ